ncbi:MAG: hypothetical protein KAS51_04750 [Candidatus Omnitrophica bacterium]|nr:hypothetical protein [Candidatus Omnitrophota bacterium]
MKKISKELFNVGIGILMILFAIEQGYCASDVVKVVQHGPGKWQLMVNDNPYFIKGMVSNYTVVGDDPNNNTWRDWAILDINNNGKIDVAYDSWVDKNYNNIQDEDELAIGDWQLLKDMGCNTLRIYQMPSDDKRINHLYNDSGKVTFNHPPNKKLFRELYENYGIRVVVGHFFGEWTIGSGANWEDGTDYTDPQQRKNLLECIRVMVEEHKDEPYTLMWMIGNENFTPMDHDNAEKNVEAFLSLVNEAAKLIKKLDPNHPVALCNWAQSYIKEIGALTPDVDIFGVNAYFGPGGFGRLWEIAKKYCDKPVLITEYGEVALRNNRLDEEYQALYNKNCWQDIVKNSYGNEGTGNSIGGIVFSWSDQWFLAGQPNQHDKVSTGTDLFSNVFGVEWFGLTGQGDGSKSPFLRQLRKAYFTYKDIWNID